LQGDWHLGGANVDAGAVGFEGLHSGGMGVAGRGLAAGHGVLDNEEGQHGGQNKALAASDQ
jgi:hypothetical protein